MAMGGYILDARPLNHFNMDVNYYTLIGLGQRLHNFRDERDFGSLVPSPSSLPLPSVPVGRGLNFHRNYYFVPYMHGAFQYSALPTKWYNGISRWFSGCAMAYFVFNDVPFVAHIALDDAGPGAKNAWNTLITTHQRCITECVMFRPCGVTVQNEIRRLIGTGVGARTTAVGIITSDLECFSVITDNDYNALSVVNYAATDRSIHRTRRLSGVNNSVLRQFIL